MLLDALGGNGLSEKQGWSPCPALPCPVEKKGCPAPPRKMQADYIDTPFIAPKNYASEEEK